MVARPHADQSPDSGNAGSKRTVGRRYLKAEQFRTGARIFLKSGHIRGPAFLEKIHRRHSVIIDQVFGSDIEICLAMLLL
jgi:hypothetical protein